MLKSVTIALFLFLAMSATVAFAQDPTICRSTNIEPTDSDVRLDLGFCLAAKFQELYSCKWDAENVMTLCRTESSRIDFVIDWQGPKGVIIRADSKEKIAIIEADAKRRILWRGGEVDTCTVFKTGEIRWCRAEAEPVVEAPKAVTGRPQARVVSANGTETLPSSVIQRVATRHVNETLRCYETALQDNPSLSGTVHVKVIFSSTGAVKGAFVDEDDGILAIDRCVSRAVETWTFPATSDGEDSIGSITFGFGVAPTAVTTL